MKKHLTNHWLFAKAEAPEKTVAFQLTDDRIDMDTLCGRGAPHGEALVTTEFELAEETKLGFGIGCEWWCEVTFNGKIVYTSMPAGNGILTIAPDNHRFVAEGIKGVNRLSIRIRRDFGEKWLFAFAEYDVLFCDPCTPLELDLDPADTTGPIRIMNAVNNGPIRAMSAQTAGNFEAWKTLDIPFARNHDAAFCSSYGGEHCVDISAVFPDLNADADDPASYDFALTDKLVADTLAAGTQTFYRFGAKIEHNIKKYGTRVPPDFKKWAVICEHIIRHYNEGWAEGFHYNMLYWEIWNEPDGGWNVNPNSTWQGTPEEFFELYRITACHLKKCFPDLKIGGPALAWHLEWMKMFLKAMTQEPRVPIDFFSWHSYVAEPEGVTDRAVSVRRILDEFGYTETESILNEWNYVRDWRQYWIYSLKVMTGLKGAVYAASVMCQCQNTPVDMLMYYDARPCGMNGLFRAYTYERLKGFYTFRTWKLLKDLKMQFKVDTQDRPGISACGATDGKVTRLLLSRYFEADDLPGSLPVAIRLKEGSMMGAKLFLLDEDHDLTEVPYYTGKDGSIRFNMAANTLVMVEI